MVPPLRIGIPGQRTPTICWLLPSTTSCRLVLVRFTLPFEMRCSASSVDAATGRSVETLPSTAFVEVTGAEVLPAASVAVSVTVKLPEAA